MDLLLQDPDNSVIGINRSDEYADFFLPYKRNNNVGNFRFHKMNLNDDMPDILDLFDREKPEVIINFAAQGEVGTSWKYPLQWFKTNCMAMANLADNLKDREYLKRYVHISTPEVYGSSEERKEDPTYYNPSTPYAASKAACDLFLLTLVKQYGFPLVMIRSTNVYGPGQQLYRIIPRSIIYLKQGKTIQLHGGGKAVKSFIHIQDVCKGILKAIDSKRKGEIFHLGIEKGYSVKEVVEKICLFMDHDFSKVTEMVEERPGQDSRYIINSNKANDELGWNPSVDFDDGLKEVITWVEENWNDIKKEPLEYVYKI